MVLEASTGHGPRAAKHVFPPLEEIVIETVATDRGPKAIGPYSQGIKANGFLFLSGQIPLDPKTQQIVAGDAARQTERVLENLQRIVAAAGSSLHRVGKTTLFLSDLNALTATTVASS